MKLWLTRTAVGVMISGYNLSGNFFFVCFIQYSHMLDMP